MLFTGTDHAATRRSCRFSVATSSYISLKKNIVGPATRRRVAACARVRPCSAGRHHEAARCRCASGSGRVTCRCPRRRDRASSASCGSVGLASAAPARVNACSASRRVPLRRCLAPCPRAAVPRPRVVRHAGAAPRRGPEQALPYAAAAARHGKGREGRRVAAAAGRRQRGKEKIRERESGEEIRGRERWEGEETGSDRRDRER